MSEPKKKKFKEEEIRDSFPKRKTWITEKFKTLPFVMIIDILKFVGNEIELTNSTNYLFEEVYGYFALDHFRVVYQIIFVFNYTRWSSDDPSNYVPHNAISYNLFRTHERNLFKYIQEFKNPGSRKYILELSGKMLFRNWII